MPLRRTSSLFLCFLLVWAPLAQASGFFGGGGSSSASNTAPYVLTQTTAGLDNAVSLGALTTGLLLNTVSGGIGTPSPYAGSSCAGGTGAVSLTAAGVLGCTASAVGLTGSPLSQFATTTSAQLAGVLSDETGSGLAVFATSPTLSNPSLGASQLTVTHTVSTGGTTANLLACFDAATGNVTTCATSAVGAVGVAKTTQSSTQSVEVGTRGIGTCVADNTVTAGNLLGVGTTTAGRCKDLGQTSSLAVSSSLQVVGRAMACSPCTAGSAVTYQAYGPGVYGAQPNAANLATMPGSGTELLYRSSASALGALSGSSISGSILTVTDLAFTGTTTTGFHHKTLTTAQRDAVSPAAAAGDAIYNSTTGRFEVYDGANWHARVRLTGDTMTGMLVIHSGAGNNATVLTQWETSGGAIVGRVLDGGQLDSFGTITLVSGSVFRTAGTLYLDSAAGNPVIFRPAAAEKVRISASGDVGIGTAAPGALIEVFKTDAVTNALTTVTILDHESSGTPAAGFGARQLVNLKSSTTASQNAAAFDVSWVVATHASRTARIDIAPYDTAARLALRLEASGTAAMLGVLGAAAVVRQASGADLTNAVTSGGTDDTIADFSDLTVFANSAAAIRNNQYQLARKLKQVNDALRLYGFLN